MKDELLTIQQAAELLGVSTKTLRRWEARGHIKPQRTVGNQRRYSKIELTTLFSKEKGKAKPLTQPVITPELINAVTSSAQSPEEKSVQPTPILQDASVPSFSAAHSSNQQKRPGFMSRYLTGTSFAIVLFVVLAMMLLNSQTAGMVFQKSMSLLTSPSRVKEQGQSAGKQVLAVNDATPSYQLRVNIPSFFGKPVVFLNNVDIKKELSVTGIASLSGGIKTNNANINAGTGKLTASNVIYSIVAGSNITISGNKQNPTISTTASGVTSLQGTTGVLSLTGGSGISLNGLEITNSGVLSVGGATGAVSLTGGSGISVSGTTITNSDTGSAQNIFKTFTVGSTDITAGSNNDTLTFAAGSGITLTGDASTKKITITNPSAPSGLSTNGVLYATGSNTFTTVAASASGYVLQSNGPNAPPSWVSNSSTSPSFSIITSGTNTQASMVVGTGASLDFTGSGTINASSLNGATFAAPGSIGSGTAGSGAFSTLSASALLSANGGLTVASSQNFTLTGFNNTGAVLYANSGVVTQTATGSDGQVLTLVGGTPTWQTSSATNYWQFSSGIVAPASITNDLAIGGTSTASALFQISGTTGNATTAGILTFGGTTAQIQSANGRTLTIGGTNTGNVVINSAGNIALTAQGANLLTGGNLSVTGNVSATGTTGFSASGIGAGLAFSGTGNHIISTSSGTLQLGGFDLLGDINGNGKNIYGLGLINGLSINNSTITNGTWNGNAVGAAYGGTGVTNYAKGDILFANSNSPSVLSTLGIGTTGQILTVSAGGIPSWSNAGGTFNFWQESSGALSPYNITDDLLLGSSATSSAKFAFVNNAGGVPTETISAGSGSNSLYLTGNGTLATTNAQALTVGSTTTGNIFIGTDATARNISIGNNTGVTGVSLTSGSGGIALNGTVTVSTLASGLVKATSGALSIAAAGTDYQVPLSFDNGITNNSNTVELGGALTKATSIPFGNFVLALGDTTGTGNLVVAPNAGGQAALIVNKQGNNDIFSASASGATRFTVSNNGNVSFTGGSGFLNTLSSSASGTQTAYIPNLASVGGQDALCFVALGNCAGSGGGVTGSGTSGQVAFFNGTNTITSNSNLYWQNSNSLLGIGTGGAAISALEVNGSYGSNAAAIINQQNNGDIFSASASGATKFTIANDGTISDAAYTGSSNAVLYATSANGTFITTASTTTPNLCLLSGAATPTWGTCVSGNTSWVESNGTIYPGNSTEDLIVGGTATSSAKFAFINVNSGTPTASVSAISTGTGLAIAGNGSLQSLNNGTLTIGGNTTGDIQFEPGGTTSSLYLATGGNVGIGTTSPAGPLSVQGSATNGTIQISNGTNSMGIGFPSTGNVNPFIGTITNTAFGIRTNNTNRLTIQPGGFVGINTSNPTAQLDVTGTASVSGEFALSGATPTLQATANQTLTIGGNTTGNITLSPLNGAAGSFVAPNTNGNVDLGTASQQFRTIYA
ncbi:MAG TPA: MerR family DNA-binding transcriptional regulator, partial [Candidatus Acidoferrales bacterium]|nr:MerR family DNA-binding transcriptional regulator [Candidatus Acidoferrales bacterium]